MIRFFFLNMFIGLHSIIFCLWGLLIYLLFHDEKKMHFLAAVPWAKIILKVSCIGVDIKGIENVDPSLPRIYMTNHQSTFDIYALLAYLPVDFKFMLKQELMKIPLLGISMRKVGYIGIDRYDPRSAVRSMQIAAEKLKKGSSVLIFPEGTRSRDGRLKSFKKGGFKLALKTGCDIVPIAIKGSYKINPKGSLRIEKGSFKMKICRPISVNEYGRGEIGVLMDRVRQEMKAFIEREE